MSLTLSEIKDLLAYGQELGLQQLQTEGLVAVYGARAVMHAGPFPVKKDPEDDEALSITQHYAALGKGQLKR